MATLTIGQRDITSTDSQDRAEAVEQLAFNPWNTTADFQPLGNLNRARKAAYDASAAPRAQTRWHTDIPVRNAVVGALTRAAFTAVNRRVPWYRLPVRTALLNLDALRGVPRADNLIDTDPPEAPPQPRPVPAPIPEDVRAARTADGRYNDLSAPEMGAVGAPFGRNLKPVYRPDLFERAQSGCGQPEVTDSRTLSAGAVAEPSCCGVDSVPGARLGLSRALSARCPRCGSASAAWHDLVQHPRREPETTMRIAGNKAFHVDADGTERLFADAVSHWWTPPSCIGRMRP